MIRFNLHAVVLAAVNSGCIAFPTAVPEQEPYKEVANEFLTTSSTTQEQLRSELGSPTLNGQNWWLYRDSRDGWAWGFCVALGSTGGVGGGGGCAEIPRGSSDYFLVAEFDESGVLVRYDVFKEDSLCEQRRICYENTLLTQAAAVDQDIASKQFSAPADGCSVYLYSDTDSDILASRVELDGREMGALVGSGGFHLFIVAPGKHQWFAYSLSDWMSGQIASIELNCDGQHVEYLRYGTGFWGLPRIDSVEASQGRAEIEKRWLAHPEAAGLESVRTNWLSDGQVFVAIEGQKVKAYTFSEPGKVKRWGIGDSGEPCGMLAAIEDYQMVPSGASRDLFVGLQLRGVCNADGDCTFPSIIEGAICESTLSTEIEFYPESTLLVIEPRGESYAELYFDKSKHLKKHAHCEKDSRPPSYKKCTISVAKLRDLQGARH